MPFRDDRQLARACRALCERIGLRELFDEGGPTPRGRNCRLADLDPAHQVAIGMLLAARAQGPDEIDEWITVFGPEEPPAFPARGLA